MVFCGLESVLLMSSRMFEFLCLLASRGAGLALFSWKSNTMFRKPKNILLPIRMIWASFWDKESWLSLCRKSRKDFSMSLVSFMASAV